MAKQDDILRLQILAVRPAHDEGLAMGLQDELAVVPFLDVADPAQQPDDRPPLQTMRQGVLEDPVQSQTVGRAGMGVGVVAFCDGRVGDLTGHGVLLSGLRIGLACLLQPLGTALGSDSRVARSSSLEDRH